MEKRTNPPWATGPAELLKHGIELLQHDTGANRRLAMISIDNAVELMLRTYLGLPKRETGLGISRKELAEVEVSFPAMLDALERYATPQKLAGIDLSLVEWYHRMRNQLYHQGYGMSVERESVEIYSVLANVVFNNLFGFRLVEEISPQTNLLMGFAYFWGKLEDGLRQLANEQPAAAPPAGLIELLQYLHNASIVSRENLERVHKLNAIRQRSLLGEGDLLTPEDLKELKQLVGKFSREDLNLDH